MRQTKIVVTLGPSTDSNEMIEKLILAGVNVFRFNFSHGTYDYHKDVLTRVRKIAKDLKKPIAALQDISGPKIRIGMVEKPIALEVGGELNFYKKDGFSDAFGVTLSYPEILDSLQVGEFIYLADGLIRVQVKELLADVVKCKVIVGGNLTSRKGVNFPDSMLNISAITEKDKSDIKFGVELGFDWMAFSFMRDAEGLKEAKKLIKDAGGDIPVMVKIEKAQALTNLDEILDEVNAVMVARGDLGVELGLYKVPPAQKRIIKEANKRGLPVVTATQMMTSMIHSPFPTRAEVSDVANAVLDGTDAVMLSDETTIGEYPVEAINALHSAIMEAETIYPFYQHIEEYHYRADATSVAAARMAEDLKPDAFIVFTATGASAKTLSKYRPDSKIITCVYDEKAYNTLSLVWGVRPAYIMNACSDSNEMVANFINNALQDGVIKKDGTYVMTVGECGGAGTTNVVRLLREQDIIKLSKVNKG